MNTLNILTIIITLFPATVCYIGFEGADPISIENFTCFLSQGYSFYMGRVYKSLGEVDTIGIENIKNARKAGYHNVDGYIFPCLLTSCNPAKDQIEEALNLVANEGGRIGRLWISVEGRDLYWEFVEAFNQAFILEAVQQAESMGYKVGIYTNSTHWEEIVGKNWNAVANKPLWLANWSGKKSFAGFVPFGGWKIPAIQQFNPDLKSSCGVAVAESLYP